MPPQHSRQRPHPLLPGLPGQFRNFLWRLEQPHSANSRLRLLFHQHPLESRNDADLLTQVVQGGASKKQSTFSSHGEPRRALLPFQKISSFGRSLYQTPAAGFSGWATPVRHPWCKRRRLGRDWCPDQGCRGRHTSRASVVCVFDCSIAQERPTSFESGTRDSRP